MLLILFFSYYCRILNNLNHKIVTVVWKKTKISAVIFLYCQRFEIDGKQNFSIFFFIHSAAEYKFWKIMIF
jgi:hypothetical protein